MASQVSQARERSTSASSLMNGNSDNPEPSLKGGTIVQRTRDALGDIGNRLSKKTVINPNPVKPPAGKMKPASSKPVVSSGALKSSENFAIPTTRAPRAVVRPENQKKQLVRSVSANAADANSVAGVRKFNSTKQDVRAKVFTNLQRSHSSKVPVEGSLKPLSNKENETKVSSTTLSTTTAPKPKTIETGKENLSDKPRCNEVEVPSIKVLEVPSIPKEKLVDESVKPVETVKEDSIESKTDSETLESDASGVSVYSCQRYDVLDIDAADENNPLLLREYIHDICNYLFALEKKYDIGPRYLEGRLVNSRMRAVLLDWLVEVHHQFGFMPETLYMASKTIDRYLQKERRITRKQLQLVGVTSMYIAAKFEEVCTPTVLDFSAVSDNAFTAADIRSMEREILKALEHDLSPPPAVFFLRRFSKAAGVSNGMAPILVHTMAKYIMELTLIDYGTCNLFPSEQAAAALALALLIMEKSKSLREQWTPTLEHYSRVSFDGLKRIMSPVVALVIKTHEDTPKYMAVYNKYGRNRMNRVSSSPELKVTEWKDRVLKEINVRTN